MLKRYDVTIKGDRIKWLGEKPKVQKTRAIIMIEEDNPISSTLKGKTLRDSDPQSPRTPGRLKGKLGEAFFDPLPEEELKQWEKAI